MKIDGKKSFDTKEYAIIDPDPNVKPKTNCGALKNLLDSGYKTINIATIKLILIVIIGVNISNTREKIQIIIQKKPMPLLKLKRHMLRAYFLFFQQIYQIYSHLYR